MLPRAGEHGDSSRGQADRGARASRREERSVEQQRHGGEQTAGVEGLGRQQTWAWGDSVHVDLLGNDVHVTWAKNTTGHAWRRLGRDIRELCRLAEARAVMQQQ